MARVIKEAVSDIVQNKLQDPRVVDFVSVTEVKLSSDMKNADVYLSIMGGDEKSQKRTFVAIEHAVGHIQSMIGQYIRSRGCPHLNFHEDKRLKKTMETMKIINEISKELEDIDEETDKDLTE